MLLDDDSDDEDDDDLDERKVTVPLTVTMIVIAGYIFGGTVLFGLWEGKLKQLPPYLLSKNILPYSVNQDCSRRQILRHLS